MKDVVLTGIKNTGIPHIGSYLGMYLPTIKIFNDKVKSGQCQLNAFIPDLHALAATDDYEHLEQNTLRNLRAWVALGLDLASEDLFIYRQSRIPAHSELFWILSCFTTFGEASRMVEFKDKSQQVGNDVTTVGLFGYPILMAADILLYNAKYIPVGDDQRQHIELARTIASRVNNRFLEKTPGGIFTVPETSKSTSEFADTSDSVRIRSLQTPEKKMSKSVSDPRGTIDLYDTPEEAMKKIRTAETDSIGVVHWDWQNQPGVTNLLQIYELLSGRSHEDVLEQWEGGERYGDLKNVCAEVVGAFLSEFQANLEKVDDSALLAKLENSEAKMNLVANETLDRVQRAVGLRS
jgi:tryptophanyl-tRNA synthetase